MKTIYLLLITLLATACNSDDTVDPASLLPPITTTGENTFGCLIDGKFFRPRDGRSTINSDNKGLRIITTETTNVEYDIRDFASEKTSSLLIHIEGFQYNSSSIYQFQESNGLSGIDGLNNNYAHCRIWKSAELGYQRYVSYPNSGNINIVNQIIQGEANYYNATFNLKLINTQISNDTIFIELGRFDLESFSLQWKDWE
jgi:hypothetical protein